MRPAVIKRLQSLVGQYVRFQELGGLEVYLYIVSFGEPKCTREDCASVYGLSYYIDENANQFRVSVNRGIIYLSTHNVFTMRPISREEFESTIQYGTRCQMRFDQFYDRALTDFDNMNKPFNYFDYE